MKFIDADTFTDYIGKELGSSDWFEINQARINAFADATLDHQFIHVDEVAAKETPFGSTIAHGFLTLSLLPHLQASVDGFLCANNLKMAVNYGFDKLRFMAPVKVDKKIRARAKLLEASERKPGQWLLKFEITVDIQGEEKPALIAEWLLMNFV